MPIEIRELHIKLKINEQDSSSGAASSQSSRQEERKASEDAMIAECIEQTLLAIEKKKER